MQPSRFRTSLLSLVIFTVLFASACAESAQVARRKITGVSHMAIYTSDRSLCSGREGRGEALLYRLGVAAGGTEVLPGGHGDAAVNALDGECLIDSSHV